MARRMAGWYTTPSVLGTAGAIVALPASISARERFALLGDCDPSDAMFANCELLTLVVGCWLLVIVRLRLASKNPWVGRNTFSRALGQSTDILKFGDKIQDSTEHRY
jgi:hypothetical protein